MIIVQWAKANCTTKLTIQSNSEMHPELPVETMPV